MKDQNDVEAVIDLVGIAEAAQHTGTVMAGVMHAQTGPDVTLVSKLPLGTAA